MVIGILIALEINNWNTQRKNEKLISNYFDQVEQDLLIDIEQLNKVIAYYDRKDSLIGIAWTDSVTFEMYNEIKGLSSIVQYYYGTSLHNNGYNNLSRNIEKVHSKYDRLMELLNKLYINDFNYFNEYAQVVRDYTQRRMENWANKYDWFHTSYTPPFEPGDARINFYLNDPHYKNTLKLYAAYNISNYQRFAIQFRDNAIRALIEMHKTLRDSVSIVDYYNEHIGELKNFSYKSCDEIEKRPREIKRGNKFLLVVNNTEETIQFDFVNDNGELEASNMFTKGLGPNDFIANLISTDTEYLLSTSEGKCLGTFRNGS